MFMILGGLLVLGFQMITEESSPVREWLRPPDSPHKAYARKLALAGLDSSSIGQKWIFASRKSLNDSVWIDFPFVAKGYFATDEPRAMTYRFEGQRGQVLKVDIGIQGEENPLLFMDLYRQGRRPDSPFERVASADSGSLTFQHQFNRDRVYMLRIQPGLLQAVSYKIRIHTAASLAFPVEGKNADAIRSFWGDRRDGGRRKHKGVDIFAPKGTPALAAADGYIFRVKEGGLGGKVVWLRDGSRGQNLYYAHLDTQMVKQGQYVKAGDTLGLVGNTGNARTTPSHLHFGVYQSNWGAVNPFPFIHVPDSNFTPLGRDTTWVGNWARISRQKVLLFSRQKDQKSEFSSLLIHTPVKVLSVADQWMEIKTAEGGRGWVKRNSLSSTDRGFASVELIAGTEIRHSANLSAAILLETEQLMEADVLAQNDSYFLVRTPQGEIGWVDRDRGNLL
jgi:murein DD-endopeptidase MepM/ murein hydrolase activator NlpD